MRSLVLALAALFTAFPVSVQAEPVRLFARVAAGGGYGGIGSEVPDAHTNNVGYAAAWEAAFGGFVHRAIALHVTTFGFYEPHSVTKYDESPRERGRGFVQSVGAGFTLTPPRDFVRAPRLRPFLSGSLGLSIVNDFMRSRNVPAFGGELLGGFELCTNSGLRIGLALQGSWTAKDGDWRDRPIQAGHIAGLLTFAYDTRPRPAR